MLFSSLFSVYIPSIIFLFKEKKYCVVSSVDRLAFSTCVCFHAILIQKYNLQAFRSRVDRKFSLKEKSTFLTDLDSSNKCNSVIL